MYTLDIYNNSKTDDKILIYSDKPSEPQCMADDDSLKTTPSPETIKKHHPNKKLKNLKTAK